MSFPLQLARGCPAVVGQPRAAFILALGVTMALTTACAPTRQRVAPPGDGRMSRELRLGGLLAMQNARLDVNRNGIDDSLDVVLGMSRDLNKNELLDIVESDSEFDPFERTFLAAQSHSADADSIVMTAEHFGDATVRVYFFIFERDQEVALWVENGSGRRVRLLVSAKLLHGPHLVSWNKADDSGRKLPPGLYWIKLRTGSGVHRHPVQWRD